MSRPASLHHCPVCQYPHLQEAPRSRSGGGSCEICPSCGYQFGVDDDDRGVSYEQWRTAWLERGAPWSGIGRSAPPGWDGKRQATTPPETGKKKRAGTP